MLILHQIVALFTLNFAPFRAFSPLAPVSQKDEVVGTDGTRGTNYFWGPRACGKGARLNGNRGVERTNADLGRNGLSLRAYWPGNFRVRRLSGGKPHVTAPPETAVERQFDFGALCAKPWPRARPQAQSKLAME